MFDVDKYLTVGRTNILTMFKRDGFEDNRDGTVIDWSTGLQWLQDTGCFGSMNWHEANEKVAKLCSGQYGLKVRSEPGGWRLPTIKEFEALISKIQPWPGESWPGLSKREPFIGVKSGYYWSGSTWVGDSKQAWNVHLASGWPCYYDKTYRLSVWPVRELRL